VISWKPFARKTGIRRYIGPKRLLGLAVMAILCLIAWYLRQAGLLDPELIRDTVRSHPVASIVGFCAIYALAVAFAVPTLPFNLAAGIFWGGLLGGMLSALATTIGAVAAFLAARWLLGQPLAKRVDNRRVQWLQQNYERRGWVFVAFTRLNPVFPTGILNYLFGLTSIGLAPYFWSTIVFILPPSIAVAWIGGEVGAMALDGNSATIWYSVLGVSAAITILFGIRIAAKFFSIPTYREPQ
jgi:uncharacterized membrane protein YdjX (TVP38/TMEM64 family)